MKELPTRHGYYWVQHKHNSEWTIEVLDEEGWWFFRWEYPDKGESITDWRGPLAPPGFVVCDGRGDVREGSCGHDDCPVPMQIADAKAPD